jgi:hypothetical protein
MRPGHPTTCGEVSEKSPSRLGDRRTRRLQPLRARLDHQTPPETTTASQPGDRQHLVLAPSHRGVVSKPTALPVTCSTRNRARRSLASPLPGQRTAVQLRPHQQTETPQVATTEPVVLTTGDKQDGSAQDDVRPSAATACWAALVTSVARRTLACLGSGDPGA